MRKLRHKETEFSKALETFKPVRVGIRTQVSLTSEPAF